MADKTLIVSKAEKLFPYWEKYFNDLGYGKVEFTNRKWDGLVSYINDYKPDNLLIGCGYYHRATPFVMMQMLKRLPEMNVAAVNIHEFPDDLGMHFIVNGVNSYVNIMEGMDEFTRELQVVRDGGVYIADGVSNRLAMRKEYPKTTKEITGRELEVLKMICCGFFEAEVAGTMQISPKTVNNHRSSLYTSLNARNTAELVITALITGLVSIDEINFYPAGYTVNPQPMKESA